MTRIANHAIATFSSRPTPRIAIIDLRISGWINSRTLASMPTDAKNSVRNTARSAPVSARIWREIETRASSTPATNAPRAGESPSE